MFIDILTKVTKELFKWSKPHVEIISQTYNIDMM